MTTPGPYPEDAYRLQAMIGMVRFMAHHLELALPWRIDGLITSLSHHDEVVVADGGKAITVLPSNDANALVALSRSELEHAPELTSPLYGLLLLNIVKHVDPRDWTVRRILPTDPEYVLADSPYDAFVVECQTGEATSAVILFLPLLAMADRFCQDGERIRETYLGLLP